MKWNAMEDERFIRGEYIPRGTFHYLMCKKCGAIVDESTEDLHIKWHKVYS